MDPNGKVAVVTGGASGIGRGIARAFAGQGMKLVLADIEQGPLDEVVREFTAAGTEAIGVRTDVSKLEQIEALAAATLDRFGAVHVLCNNAGIGMSNPIGATSMADWRWTRRSQGSGNAVDWRSWPPAPVRTANPAHKSGPAQSAGQCRSR